METLDLDAEATYDPSFLDRDEADRLFVELLEGYDVTNRRIVLADGREHTGETGAHIFADAELTSHEALHEVWGPRSPWPESLAAIRDRIQERTGVRFRVARCIHYADGDEGVDFHRDLPAYGDTSVIASLSLGAPREFVLRRIDDPTDRLSVRLEPGSLLVMGEGCQERYEHALPRDPRCRAPRLNLTFRTYGWD